MLQRIRNTREVFGDYIDIYDMTQAVEDGATRPVYYESRVIKLKFDEATLHLIDQEYDIMANNADPEEVEKSKKELGQMEAVLGNDATIDSLVNDILDHYENYRADLLTGKAMEVAYSRAIAMKIYNRFHELRPSWKEKVKVVMTESNKDPEEWCAVIGNKHRRDELAKEFKDNNSEMKIAIVVDMWLTGFDVPSLASMYVYKPMQGYNLMQAIARVNRVFQDKEGGLNVDYVGIASALKQAMNDYTARDKKNYGDTDIAKVVYPKLLEKLSICRDLFHGYDYSKFTNGTDLERSKAITGAVNFIVGTDKEREREDFIKEALLLRQALSLCSSLIERDLRVEAAFFESVRVLVMRLMNQGEGKKISLPEMNARINEPLKSSIKSDGVINLFSDVKEEFSLFDPKFLEEISKMKEKNLAVELLKKLIAEQVQIYRRTNVVKSEKFSEIIQGVMNRGVITEDDLIEIIKMCISYVFRRSICDIPTNSLNKTFATLRNEIKADDYMNSIKVFFVLRDDYKEFPDDEKFERAFVSRDIYNMRSRNFILSHLENFGNKAPIIIENYTIEHIMPQKSNPRDEWKTMLGANWKEVQKTYLHTIGNLTLTAYNSEMSDNPFMVKMDMEGGFKESALRLNAYLVKLTEWNEQHIKERA